MDRLPFLAPLESLHLSEDEKRHIRANILNKRNKTLFLKKVRYYTKITSYAAVSAFGVFLFVSAFMPQSPWKLDKLGPSILTFKPMPGSVQADTIGRLLEIQGVVQVINNGTIIPTQEIKAGDLVVLQPGAEIVVQVGVATFAKLIGPAKFILEIHPDKPHTYILNILEGTSVEVNTSIPKSVDTPQPKTTSITPTPENVVVKTKYLEVSAKSTEQTHFTIAQVDTSATVTSSEGDILVKQILTTTAGQELIVSAGDTLHVDDEHGAKTTPADEKQLALLADDSKELHIRYARPEEGKDTSTPDTSSSIIAELKAQFDEEQKEIFSPELLNQLQQSVHPTLTDQNIGDMRASLEQKNIDSFLIAYRNLLEELQQAYRLVKLPQPAVNPSVDSLSAGAQVAQNLLVELQKIYFVPPSLQDSIRKIAADLRSIKSTLPAAPAEHPSAEEEEQPDAPTPDTDNSATTETTTNLETNIQVTPTTNDLPPSL